MAVVSASPIPQLLLLLLPLLFATNQATVFSVTNLCSYTVWPAAVPGGGVQLQQGETWTINVPNNTTGGRLWARIGCSFDGKGNGSCQTGDCGGVLECKGYGQPPNTIAEFSLGQFNNLDFFDISLVLGFNVPMNFLATLGGPGCIRGRDGKGPSSNGPRCGADIMSRCPGELVAPGGCNSACTVFNTDEYCCSRTSNCEPTNYSIFFKQMCPDAYSYPKDDSSSTFTCPVGTDYQVTFCPLISLASSPVAAPAGPNRMHSSIIRRLVVILAPLGGFVLLTLLFIITFFVRKRRTQRHQEMDDEEEIEELQGMPARFTFRRLEVATEQFRHKLGEGGFGSVFKGQIGEERIAVKRLDQAGQGKKGEFSAEVLTIGRIHHINLVRLVGFCAEKSHRLLVYEYMPKGSLNRWIYCQHGNDAPALDWRTRCKIVTHIAKGLSYLHEECTRRIAHLDIKPQNILLDDDFNAKLSDFGLCKLIDRDISQVVTRMRGTPGYLAPEWLTSQITEKADIYSFGIVVMEIISGRKNLDTSRSEESIHLVTLLEEKVKSGQLVDLIDKNSNDMQEHEQEVIQMINLAMWCLQIDCKKRPLMSEVVKVLQGTMNVETNIDHNFVATGLVNFGTVGNVCTSAPPLASNVSGPR